MNAIIFDTETTDANEPQLIEAAWIRAHICGNRIELGESFERRYKPSKEITSGAMATHHILDSDLIGCPPSSTFALPDDVTYIIGHKVDFDWEVIGSPAHVKRICTLALARNLWPHADSHSLTALMYRLSIDRARTRELVRNAHSALTDCGLCGWLLCAMNDAAGPFESWEALWTYSEAARVPEIMPFGKHKGEHIKAVPSSYRQWLLKQPDVDPYLRKALEAA
ncbi:3'-5' exonuclease [Caballeronia sp. LZ033]|uniref:3'-5' exonuclease n=1 Tax=Caballeronia sp. LZ033 TaxID=3038566 RepID=UPI002860B40A|nr:3'-5' exonuclease [Caballeronia sp. LZ033]MDR5813361.1 3'-5' exonuclease [Caballeronia sp. LZ033]